MISWTQLGKSILVQPFATTVMMRAPISEPETVPSPPLSLRRQ